MITDPFDTGPTGAFKTLCQNYPDDTGLQRRRRVPLAVGADLLPWTRERTARLLVIGQDPAQTEAVTRRILSGQAGRRVQGFVEKLGFTKRYLMINAFLYGIYNQNMALPHLNDPDIQAYRHQWLEAAFAPGKIEAVVTFGNPAFTAWTAFQATPAGQAVTAGSIEHSTPPPTNPVARSRARICSTTGTSRCRAFTPTSSTRT